MQNSIYCLSSIGICEMFVCSFDVSFNTRSDCSAKSIFQIIYPHFIFTPFFLIFIIKLAIIRIFVVQNKNKVHKHVSRVEIWCNCHKHHKFLSITTYSMNKTNSDGGHLGNCHGGCTIHIYNVQQDELDFPMP